MANLKHIGKIKTTNRKCIVAYRVVPKEPDNCIVVYTETLDADMHDSLMKLVEGNAGQTAYELADAMGRTLLPDGRNMLATFHQTGKLNKVPTNLVIMVPNNQSSILLSELNETIATQKGVSVEDLAVSDPSKKKEQPKPAQTEMAVEPSISTTASSAADGVLTDEDLASQYRSQADALFKEAKKLREQAEELVPTKKATRTKKSEESV